MIPIISWKDIWRNKLRSLVVITAVTLGLFAGIFSSGVMQGMMDRRIEAGINTETSNIQIHQTHFLDNYEPAYSLPSPSDILAYVGQITGVKAVTPRTRLVAMAASAEAGSGIMVSGVRPETEKMVTDIQDHLIDGAYLSDEGRLPVLIGKKLAEKLNVRVRSKIVLTLQQADGHITAGAFRVAGIYKTSNTMYDEMNVFVRQQDINTLAGYPDDMTHEIAVRLDDNDLTREITAKISEHFPELDVQAWYSLQKELGMMTTYMNQMLYVFMLIILLALAFGIVNTMLMVVLERIKEIGMLMAIGMTRTRVFLMIMLETIFLSITGAAAGMVISALVMAYFYRNGLYFTSFAEGFEAYGFEAVAYPYVKTEYYVVLAVMVMLTAVIASIYPAVKALRLNPADAVRSE